jgi:hypothetical protein
LSFFSVWFFIALPCFSLLFQLFFCLCFSAAEGFISSLP